MTHTLSRLAGCVSLMLALFLNAGCVSESSEPKPPGARLTPSQVKHIVAKRALANGWHVEASEPWDLTFQLRGHERVWVAILKTEDIDYWLLVDDATGSAEFMMPTLHPQEHPHPPGEDWLAKIDDGLARTKYPIGIEQLLRNLHLEGVTCDGGGRFDEKTFFLDYTLRHEKDTPARFNLRCYYLDPGTDAHPKIIIHAELTYVDSYVRSYRLTRMEN